MRCGQVLKISVLVLFLLSLASVHSYSLDTEEVADLTAILTDLNEGLTKIESGLKEASSEQAKLEEELNVLGKQTKLLEADLHEQKKAQLKLEAQLENLRDSYESMESRNRILTWVAGGAVGMSIAAGLIAIF